MGFPTSVQIMQIAHVYYLWMLLWWSSIWETSKIALGTVVPLCFEWVLPLDDL